MIRFNALGIFTYIYLFCIHFADAKAQSVPFGYVTDVVKERKGPFHYEIYIPPDKPTLPTPIIDRIFVPEIAKEFKNRYREKFGQIYADSTSYSPTQIAILDYRTGATRDLQKLNTDKKQFAEYMMRRLFEFHVDRIVRTDPDLRPIYETKEKLSKIKVQVTAKSRVEMKYSFAGNLAELMLIRPNDQFKLAIQMDPGSFFITTPDEYSLVYQRPLERNMKFGTVWNYYQGRANFELSQMIKPGLSVGFGFSGSYRESMRIVPPDERDVRLSSSVSYFY